MNKYYHVTETGLAEGVALGRITVVLAADFHRVRGERDALQLLLNTADQRVDDLQTDLTKAREAVRANHEWHQLYDDCGGYADSALCSTNIAVLAHQSAPAAKGDRDDDIPDFTPGNGNKARRRAEALKPSIGSLVQSVQDQRDEGKPC